MAGLVGISSTIAAMKKEIKQLEQQGVEEVRNAATIVVRKMQSRTPVWTGETVRNYTAGIGSKNPARSPGSGEPPPGSTPSGLGNEMNRGSNERAALGAIRGALAALKNLKRNVFITNTINSGKWDLIDRGSAPTAARARNPGGVSALSIQGARATLKNWK
jgi:hypothetical protein